VSDQEYWQVRIALNYQELDTIRRAMFAVMPRERWSVRPPRDDDGESPTLLIDVRAKSHAAAEVEGGQIYARARKEAALPSAPPLLLGVLTPLFGPEPYGRLLDDARVLIESQRYELAVVRAQTACELFARQALDWLAIGLVSADQQPSSLFRKLSLVDRRDRALLQALTGMAIHREAWWDGYRGHLTRRNQVVHDGLSVSEQQADASLKAAHLFIAFLRERSTEQALGKPWESLS
jgi:HEPN domain-containing protein